LSLWGYCFYRQLVAILYLQKHTDRRIIGKLDNFKGEVMRKAVIATVVVIIIVGLGVGGYFVFHKSKTPTQTSSSTTSQTTASTATKKINLTTVMTNLQKQFPTVTQTYIYSANQDPNNELGKAGGYYIAGAEFYDTQTNTPPDGTAFGADSGGAIEVYANTSDAAKRATYLEGFQSDPTLNPGAVKQVGVYVLRASENYTASQQTVVINFLTSQVQ
jgi:hypothetical protein